MKVRRPGRTPGGVSIRDKEGKPWQPRADPPVFSAI